VLWVGYQLRINKMLKLNVVAKGKTEGNSELNPGDVVFYKCHVPGGNIKIQFDDGKTDIAHPLCFKELR
jgi:hypothetical protein